MAQISITINGKVRSGQVEPRTLLVHFLREQLNLTGTHVGCDTSQCGACTVLIDGRSAKSCTILAVQADGCEVTTIEGLATGRPAASAAGGFWEEHGLQCGYCTPGMIMSAVNLLSDNPQPTEHQIREGISGNFCRCTGYQHIVNAIQHAARKMGAVRKRGSHAHLSRASEARGQRVKRREDPRLIQGRGTYVDDVKIAGMQHMAFKRSDIAHGRIRSIDTSAAEGMPASKPSSPARRSREFLKPMPIGTPFPSPEHRAVAIDVVRYVGEPVAVVVAAIAISPATPPTRSSSTTSRCRRSWIPSSR